MLEELRKKYPKFIYESYSYNILDDNLVITFKFRIGLDLYFNPTITIEKVPIDRFKTLDINALDNLIFTLGLAEIPSYWKATCSPKIIIMAGNLDNNQIAWWHKLFIKGMGQYFFENTIDFTNTDFLTIETTKKKTKFQKAQTESESILIPVGGGKDSTVTLELLKKAYSSYALVVNTIHSSENIVKESGVKKIGVIRKIDQKLLDLNKSGFLNGHTPITSVISCLSVLVSYLFDISMICFSNEASSNEVNTSYLDHNINHQYSKTLEFENDFRQYNTAYLSNVIYVSFLRPLNELQIVEIFSKMTDYHMLFRSCNVGQKKGIWCNTCPKCLSTYILLHAYLGPEKTIKIFGEDLYLDKKLTSLLSQLLDETKIKPFECVGSRDELKVALFLSRKFYTKIKLPPLLADSKIYTDDYVTDELIFNVQNYWGENNLTDELTDLLQSKLHE